jgi:RNA polymerase sigma-32 factor
MKQKSSAKPREQGKNRQHDKRRSAAAGTKDLGSGKEVTALLDTGPTPQLPVPARTTSLPAQHDPLSAYLKEMRRYPRLSVEEEHSLAVQYHEKQDLQAAYSLVSSNLWLVVKVAREYEQAARSLLDLIQEGNIGLMEAIKNFDPYRGVRFPSYAVYWIRAYMIRFIISNLRMVKIGTTQAQRKLFFNLKKEKEKLEREGFYAAPKLLAERLQVKESEIVEMEQRLGGNDVSFDAPLSSDSESDFFSVLPAEGDSAEDLLLKKQTAELLKGNLDIFHSTLNLKERAIFDRRMLAEEKATLQDLSEDLALSRERVRQIENKVREKLKIFLEEHMGKELENIDW